MSTGRLSPMRGRFAPSPTGPLHLGNLRTALVAWLAARSAGGSFVVRVEDLDRVTSSEAHERGQLRDLAALGLDHDGDVVRQSERFELHLDAVADLRRRGLVYPCYCTRREIREAASAPNAPLRPDGAYPGTCRELTSVEREARDALGRPPALRLRTDAETYEIEDLVADRYVGSVDDVVLVRNDGVPAYNLAVVVDDHLQGITQVVRGDDLLSSTPRQVHLQRLLGISTPEYAHVPLILGPDGARLAKRHGAVTLAELADRGRSPADVLAELAASLGLCRPEERPTAAELVPRFSFADLPTSPWQWHDAP